jgi:dienelactone hydrolase
METPMKRALTLKTRMLALIVIAGTGAGIVSGHGQEAPGNPAANAAEVAGGVAASLADDLVNRRFDAIVARFTPEMASGLPAPALERIWSGILAQAGAVKEVGRARSAPAPVQGAALVIVPVRLERMAVDLKVSIAGEKVAGLFFAPAELPPQSRKAPAYVDPAKFTDVAVTVGTPATALGGTLSLPNGVEKAPVVVLIHGSGPGDRDETIGPNRPFRDIAEGLASRGVAALRYDKRTKVHPEQFAGAFTVRQETMDDVVAAVALLAQRSEIDARRIVIVGHSLGGTLAPRIAEGRTDIAGVVIMAGATRPLPLVMVEQVEYITALKGPADETIRKRIDEMKSEAARAMAAKAGDTTRVLAAPASYWADLNAYDPAATAARLSLPLLLLQGGRDYQVTAADLQRFKTALADRTNVTIREFPRLNHLFMDGDSKSRPEEYSKAGHVDAAVIEALAGFVSGL